jgi:superfamily II DNA or RNA helicase
MPGSGKRIWWRCPKNPSHQWHATILNRVQHGTGCPYCSGYWTLEAIRGFVASLKEHLESFTPAELYILFQQNGLLRTQGSGKGFVKALATGRFPKEEIEKFVNGDPSLVDDFVQDPRQTLEALDASDENVSMGDNLLDRADGVVDEVELAGEPELPVVETKDVLGSLGLHAVSSADEEAVEFLLASAAAKIWKHAYRQERAAAAQADAFTGDGYAEEVRSRFLDEYRQAKDLAIPQGYAFQVSGRPAPPNLMQRHFAVRVRERKRVGNWSGTGAGKTLAAVLSTRVVGSQLTVICCPNSVVEGWRHAILDIFPDSVVAIKTFEPDWSTPSPEPSSQTGEGGNLVYRYLVVNYEAFQQPNSAERVRSLVEREAIDFVIVDEIHYAKQRAVENISQRRQLVAALTTLAGERKPDLRVLGMSATPVINNLQEGKSMVELVSGVAHDELDTRATVANCMTLHQRLVALGIRWMPEYDLRYEQIEVAVSCSELINEIRSLGRNGTPLALEQILTRARLPAIRNHIEPKTLIYTHYVQGIDRLLRDSLVEDGWKVGFFTGDDKSGLEGFLEGDIDVLIGSSAIGTGVDGLQSVCNRLIVNVLPWTAAEFEQLKGRIYRQGQSQKEVTLILPLTYADVQGERWSWCESKMQRLRFKKSIADAAVDGVVPEGHLRTPAQAYQDVMAWLERLKTGELQVIARPQIVIPLADADPNDGKRRHRRYGDFSTMNRTWNQSLSETTHARLQENPEEWAQYHTLYREARKDWAVVPYEEMIRWCRQRSGYVIGDFGCGEAKLAEAVSDRHTVYSFDHVAANDDVVACDMTHVPLDDETLDVAIFSLSLMSTNFADCIREAKRTLKLDGQLHVIEATERFSDKTGFAKALEGLGFAVVSVEDKWKFTHIRALKTERQPRQQVELRF